LPARISFVAHRNDPKDNRMPKRRCRFCSVELDRVAIAGGGKVLFCATCDAVGDDNEVTGGARLWPAGWATLAGHKRNQGVRIKVRYSGKKSLTA
jgi:hypothetical protein